MHHGNINHFTFLTIIILQSVALDNQICHNIVDDSLTTNHPSICSVMFLTRIFSNNMKLSNRYFLKSVSRMSRMINFRHDCDVTTILFSDFPYKRHMTEFVSQHISHNKTLCSYISSHTTRLTTVVALAHI